MVLAEPARGFLKQISTTVGNALVETGNPLLLLDPILGKLDHPLEATLFVGKLLRLVYSLPDWVKHTFVKRVESREGLRQLSVMKEIEVGTGEYRIVRVLDKKPGQRPLEDGTDEA